MSIFATEQCNLQGIIICTFLFWLQKIRWRKFGSDSPDDGTRRVKLLGNALWKQVNEKKETECKQKNEKTL